MVYESFTIFVIGKEYRSKTNITHIEKTNTNVKLTLTNPAMITHIVITFLFHL